MGSAKWMFIKTWLSFSSLGENARPAAAGININTAGGWRKHERGKILDWTQATNSTPKRSDISSQCFEESEVSLFGCWSVFASQARSTYSTSKESILINILTNRCAVILRSLMMQCAWLCSHFAARIFYFLPSYLLLNKMNGARVFSLLFLLHESYVSAFKVCQYPDEKV